MRQEDSHAQGRAKMEDGGAFALFPITSLKGNNNYKQYYFILPDGAIQKRVFLDTIDDRHREFLICAHYIMWSARFFLKEGDGINILARDCPWDFALSVNDKDSFFVEITAIADNKTQHVINKREQRVAATRNKEVITLHELKKLNDMFPDSEIAEEITRYEKADLDNNDIVKNPWNARRKQIFTTSMPPPESSLDHLIQSTIQSKISKKHAGKEKTTLIIDNRTSLYDASDVMAAASKIEKFLEQCPFPEIWFYTGYFSDNDGQNAEFSFMAFKLPPDRERCFLLATAKRTPDEKGRYLTSPDSDM